MNITLPKHIDVNNPQFEKAGKIHDWRNYVPQEIENIWENLSLKERILVAFMAEKQATNEEWD